MSEARANAGLQRAVHLFRLGWRPEAVGEWNFALRGMSDRQLLAAAELARAEDIYDRVVNTSERTETEVDFSQRYIAPFEGRVAAQANAISLDPARSEEHTSELQSLMRISYAVFCLKNKI